MFLYPHTVSRRPVTSVGGGDIETVIMQENKAYDTVIPVKRNECYDWTNTDTVYEIIPT